MMRLIPIVVIRLPCILAAFLILWIMGCQNDPDQASGAKPQAGPDTPGAPRIVPDPTPSVALPVNSDLLKEMNRKGVRVIMPTHNGDGFVAAFRPKAPGTESPKSDFETVLERVDTVLKATGFAPGIKGLSKPPPKGVILASSSLRRVRRPLVEYFFFQKHVDLNKAPTKPDGVPVEYTGIRALGYPETPAAFLTGRVFLISPQGVVNRVALTEQEAARRATEAINQMEGVCCTKLLMDDVRTRKQRARPPTPLVLLPGGAVNGQPAFRYAHRFTFTAQQQKIRVAFQVWADAETGKILQLLPLLTSVSGTSAQGRTFRRDAGLLPASKVTKFEVDAADQEGFGLELSEAFTPLLQGDMDRFKGKVKAPDDRSSGIADFDREPWKNVEPARAVICELDATDPDASKENRAFQTIDLMGILGHYRRIALDLGYFAKFPARPMSININDSKMTVCSGTTNKADSINFGRCDGNHDNENSKCPDARGAWLNPIHDHTVVAHEVGHILTSSLLEDQLWCLESTDGEGAAPYENCPKRSGNLLHDFADSWAHALEGTNCVGGWMGKNQGGTDAGRNCARDYDSYHIPRLSETKVPFDPKDPGDHFPEHRLSEYADVLHPPGENKDQTDPYGGADMQIAAAALWAEREGLWSKARDLGSDLHRIFMASAVRTSGYLGPIYNDNERHRDLPIYWRLLDLEVELAIQWSLFGVDNGPPDFLYSGSHFMNKATAAFAAAGVFLVPPHCLDDDPLTADNYFCPDGENGADAVIDVDDNDESDDEDTSAGGFRDVIHREKDYLKRDGNQLPFFHIWTGPRYHFKDGNAILPNAALCNSQFKVELAPDESFKKPYSSSELSVNVKRYDDQDSGKTRELVQCYAKWPSSDSESAKLKEAWETLKTGARLYYRVTTWAPCAACPSGKKNERMSTRPASGLFKVRPPYAVINDTGRPEVDIF